MNFESQQSGVLRAKQNHGPFLAALTPGWQFLGLGLRREPTWHTTPQRQVTETNQALRALASHRATPTPSSSAVPAAEATRGSDRPAPTHSRHREASSKPRSRRDSQQCWQVAARSGYHTFCNYSQHSGLSSAVHQRGTSSYWG